MFYALFALTTCTAALAVGVFAIYLDIRARDEMIRRLELDVQQTQEQIAVLREESEA